MSRKIPVSAPQAPLQTPFAALEAATRPDAPAPSAPSPAKSPTKTFRVVLRRENSGRGGKTVLVISQLPTHLSPPEIENLCRDARRALGCGGAMSGRDIELQGDQPDRVRNFLAGRGFTTVGP